MSLTENKIIEQIRRFPRVSGDEPTPEITPSAPVMFSPRERG